MKPTSHKSRAGASAVSAGTDTSEPATVVECFGRRAIVQTADRRIAASVFGKRTSIVCGDQVRVGTPANSDELQVLEVMPRRTSFSRTDSRGRIEVLAANLDLLAVVFAPEPEPDLYIVDRYLAGAAYASLDALIVFNKSDLGVSDWLEDYRRAGYTTLEISAKEDTGLEALRAGVNGKKILLAGQSGVGKSTLANALVPQSQRPTRELSSSSGEGRHTTVSSAWFDMPNNGALIDSPGVRDYAPPPLTDDKVQVGWSEILALAPSCRFNNCLHLREPGCAVLKALDDESISQRRYDSYRRLLNLMRQLAPSHERF